jgi:multidrug efflux pump subunit AcrB
MKSNNDDYAITIRIIISILVSLYVIPILCRLLCIPPMREQSKHSIEWEMTINNNYIGEVNGGWRGKREAYTQPRTIEKSVRAGRWYECGPRSGDKNK